MTVHESDRFALNDSAFYPELAIRIRDRRQNTIPQFEITAVRRKRIRIRLRMLANRKALKWDFHVERKIPPRIGSPGSYVATFIHTRGRVARSYSNFAPSVHTSRICNAATNNPFFRPF